MLDLTQATWLLFKRNRSRLVDIEEVAYTRCCSSDDVFRV